MRVSPAYDGLMRVMIVEDDTAIRERFARAIAADARAMLVEQAATGREAIARLAVVRPDVLLVDLGLPDVHGTEVIRHAARTLPKCDVMVITVFADERSVLESVESGACGYVLKDCTDAEFVDSIAELRAGGAPMSPGIARIVLSRLRKPAQRDDGGLSSREAVDVITCDLQRRPVPSSPLTGSSGESGLSTGCSMLERFLRSSPS
jgi:DNA-binding NarL/FixJ family response regulator